MKTMNAAFWYLGVKHGVSSRAVEKRGEDLKGSFWPNTQGAKDTVSNDRRSTE